MFVFLFVVYFIRMDFSLAHIMPFQFQISYESMKCGTKLVAPLAKECH